MADQQNSTAMLKKIHEIRRGDMEDYFLLKIHPTTEKYVIRIPIIIKNLLYISQINLTQDQVFLIYLIASSCFNREKHSINQKLIWIY